MSVLAKCIAVVLQICVLTSAAEAGRILGLWHMGAPSHYILGSRLFRELASRGHDVTMISVFSEKNKIKNYRTVALTGFPNVVDGETLFCITILLFLFIYFFSLLFIYLMKMLDLCCLVYP